MSRRPRRPRRARPRLSLLPGTAAPGAGRDAGDAPLRLRARGPADLLALIPYKVGFHPEESVVVVFVGRGRIGLTARIDLPAPTAAGAFAAMVKDLAGRHGADEVILVAYSEHAEAARALLAGALRALPRRLVWDALYVDGARWWSTTCSQPCCPAEGTPYDVEGHRLAAEAVFAGLTALGSRAELAARLAGPPEVERDGLGRLADEVRAERSQTTGDGLREAGTRLLDLLEAALPRRGELDDRQCAELALLVADILVRDVAWSAITTEDAEEHLALWLRVVNRVLPEQSAGPLALVGIAGWMSGNGALLNCAAEELARRHPGYSMGEVLTMISAQALPPRVGEELRRGLVRDLERLAG